MKFSIGVLSLLLVLVTHVNATAQGRFVPNYDETAIPDYELPSCLITNEGTVVSNAAMWEQDAQKYWNFLSQRFTAAVRRHAKSCIRPSVKRTTHSGAKLFDARLTSPCRWDPKARPCGY